MPRKPPPEGSPLYALGNLIKARRIARGLTQSELANLCGAGFTTVQQWEAGQREPGIESLLRIARRCDMPLSQFVSSLDEFPVKFPDREMRETTRVRRKPPAC